MNKILLILLLVLIADHAGAQTFAEWFRQKKTQQKYLLQQIAGLQLYLGYLKKGYTITQKGLAAISDVKNGTFHLHDSYFQSLRNVNPGIQTDQKVMAAVTLQDRIVQSCRWMAKEARTSDAFTGDEKDYIVEVSGRLAKESRATLNNLQSVIMDGRLEMKDGERLQRIDALYDKLLAQYRFCWQFSHEVRLLAAQREKEQNDIKTSRALQGLKNNER